MAQKPMRVSSLSASATATDDRVGRHAVGGAGGCSAPRWRARPTGLALRSGVVAAHEALELGELADHLADEVGLGEVRRALGEGRVGADDRGQLPGEGGDAVDALALRAELLVEDDGSSASPAGLPAGSFDPSPRKTSRWRALPAQRAHCRRRSPRRRPGLEVRDEDEAVGERAFPSPCGERSESARADRVRGARRMCRTEPHPSPPAPRPRASPSPQGEGN